MVLLDTAAGAEERYRFPSYLYINYADSGIDATDIFMEKVSSADFEILQPEDSKTPIKWSDPEPMDINQEAALISLVDFTRESKTPAQLVWTLHMDNGDTVKLSMDLAITPTTIYDYNSENADLSDTAALQALMERAAEEVGERDTINIYLPPCHLHGTAGGSGSRLQSDRIGGRWKADHLYGRDPDGGSRKGLLDQLFYGDRFPGRRKRHRTLHSGTRLGKGMPLL